MNEGRGGGGFEVVIQPAKFRNKAGQDQVCQP